MRLWSVQKLGFYDDLIKNGIAYCTRLSDFAKDEEIAYRWMIKQMMERIGVPPLHEIRMPVWAWYQYSSKKCNKPPLSPKVKSYPEEKEMMIEFEAPNNLVLLSDYMLWHHPLNYWDICRDKQKAKLVDKYFHTEFKEKPVEIQKLIMESWDVLFDLDFRDRYIAPKHKKNRPIQATLWCIKKEWVVSAVEF